MIMTTPALPMLFFAKCNSTKSGHDMCNKSASTSAPKCEIELFDKSRAVNPMHGLHFAADESVFIPLSSMEHPDSCSFDITDPNEGTAHNCDIEAHPLFPMGFELRLR
jgi:hypothetical protein